MKCTKASPKENLTTILKSIIFLVLFVISVFFMKEVWYQFRSKDTGMKQIEKPIFDFPTITICASHNTENYLYGEDFNISYSDIIKHSLPRKMNMIYILAIRMVPLLSINEWEQKLKKTCVLDWWKVTREELTLSFTVSSCIFTLQNQLMNCLNWNYFSLQKWILKASFSKNSGMALNWKRYLIR